MIRKKRRISEASTAMTDESNWTAPTNHSRQGDRGGCCVLADLLEKNGADLFSTVGFFQVQKDNSNQEKEAQEVHGKPWSYKGPGLVVEKEISRA